MFDNAQTWRASMQGVEADIEDEFGEALRITPVVPAIRGQPSPLPEQAKDARGVFSNPSALALKPGKGTGAEDPGVIVQTRKPRVALSLATLNGLGFPVVRGTHVERIEAGELYEVKASAPDGVSRVVYELTQLGRPSALSGLSTARADVPVVEGPGLTPPVKPSRVVGALPLAPIRPVGR